MSKKDNIKTVLIIIMKVASAAALLSYITTFCIEAPTRLKAIDMLMQEYRSKGEKI